MKRLYYVTTLFLLLCSFCACGNTDTTSNANNQSTDEITNENSGNFSSEMFIEASTDVIIVEME